jgi:hypothetical protein
MTLLAGDLTTYARAANWIIDPLPGSNPLMQQLITSMSAMIHSKLNRARLYSQTFTRVFDGVGNMQLMLPDYPVTSVTSVQVRQSLVPQRVLVPQGTTQPANTSQGYGWSLVPWAGNLPGDPAMLEFVNGYFPLGAQNIAVTYQAGYLIQGEAWTVPATPFEVTVQQPQGCWCRDNGVVYAETGVALVPVTAITAAGQYIPPTDATPGLYTFGAADVGAAVLTSYSFIPADLEEATIQMVAERLGYRSRIGQLSKSLGGQETISYLRGGRGKSPIPGLPPEVADMVWPYVSVIPPAIGAPV